ncbi:MAG: glycosyltransferase family 4 protein [Phycisphaerales bacterium]|nr:glycosyltransferase family 4 protein [Phycisphaerales bacterium]
MKIGFVTTHNVKRRPQRTASYLFEAMSKFATVEHVVPETAATARLGRIGTVLNRRFSSQPRNSALEVRYAAEVSQRCSAGDLDLIVGLYASAIIPRLELPDGLPVVHISDSTMQLHAAPGSGYPRPNRRQLRNRCELDNQTCRRIDLGIYPSEWAAESAVRDCGLPPDRARVVEWGGAGEDDLPSPDRRPPRQGERIELVFIGQAWLRKGLDRALAATEHIADQGRPIRLTTIGCRIPRRLKIPQLRELGTLALHEDKDRELFETVLQESTCLVHPARSECYGHVLVEACARGVPVICTRVEGMPTIIRDGENGLLLPSDPDIASFVSAILRIADDDALAHALCQGARRAWEERLSWAAWGRRFAELVEPLLACRSDSKDSSRGSLGALSRG